MLPTYAWLAILMTRAELGDVATWIGAIANVATLGLALVAGIVSFRIYKIESGRDQRAEEDRRERAEDERRSQAQLISVWYGQASGTVVTQFTGRSTDRRVVFWAAHILNGSRSPIYDVTVYFSLIGADRDMEWAWRTESIRVVPPRDEPRTVRLPSDFAEGQPETILRHAIGVTLEFRDAAGRRWLRDHMGYLHPAPTMREKERGTWPPTYPTG